jgi:molybdopterin converting factor subunit 1
MTCRIQLFAVARQRLGRPWVQVPLPPGATVATLRRALAAEFPALADVAAQARVAINSHYASEDTAIPADAEIAMIPPVSGG